MMKGSICKNMLQYLTQNICSLSQPISELAVIYTLIFYIFNIFRSRIFGCVHEYSWIYCDDFSYITAAYLFPSSLSPEILEGLLGSGLH